MISKKRRVVSVTPTVSKRNSYVGFIAASFILLVYFTFHFLSLSDGLHIVTTNTKNRRNSTFTNALLQTQASLGFDPPNEDVVKEYCRKQYTPDGRFHEAFRVLHLFKRSALFLDIGAHEGLTTFPPIACSPMRHRVITVEPVSKNIDLLLTTAKQLGIHRSSHHWNLIHAAFSNTTLPSASMYVPSGREDNSALDNLTATANVGGSATAETVKIVRGDDEIFDKGIKPDVIKIDVQGFELMVMKGLDKMLSEKRNLIVVSEYDSRLMLMNHIETIEPFDFLVAKGFKCFCAPSLRLDRNGVVYANDSKDELTRELMMTPGGRVPDVSKCGDLTYIKYVPS